MFTTTIPKPFESTSKKSPKTNPKNSKQKFLKLK